MRILIFTLFVLFLCIPVFSQEMDVNQGGTPIPDAGSYDFGNVEVGSSSSTVFTIVNASGSSADLSITTPITVTGSAFSCTAQPATMVASNGGSTTFTIQFAPASVGAAAGAVSISNNDANENPYNISLAGTGTNPLPVNLLAYEAKLDHTGAVLLRWSTAAEQDNDYFLLEHSTDGREFHTIASIEPQSGGSSTLRQDYSYTDPSPAAGRNYYRLSQFDRDGKSKVLGTRVVYMLLNETAWKVYPNPVKNQFTITLPVGDPVPTYVNIFDGSGKLIYRKQIIGSAGMVHVRLDHNPKKGVYTVQVDGVGSRIFVVK